MKKALGIFLSVIALSVSLGPQTISTGNRRKVFSASNPPIRCNSYYTTASSSYNANFCAGTAAGDLVVGFVENGYDLGTAAPPTGWSPIAHDVSTTSKVSGWWKYMTSSDISTGYVTLTFVSGYNANIALITFTGSTGAFREGTLNVTNSNGSTLTMTATTSAVASTDTMLYFAAYRASSGAVTFNRGTALNSGSTADGIGADAYEYLAAPGPISATVNFGSTGHSGGAFQAAIQNAPTYKNIWSVFPTSASATNRNNLTGTVGGAFVPAVNITVYGLGRLYISGNTQNHAAYIWDTSATSSPIATCTILAATTSDAYGYKYCSLGSPVSLTASHNYRLSIDENNGGDTWLDASNAYTWNVNAQFPLSQSWYNTSQATYPNSAGPSVLYDSLAIQYQ
jgi:hypothetical protein